MVPNEKRTWHPLQPLHPMVTHILLLLFPGNDSVEVVALGKLWAELLMGRWVCLGRSSTVWLILCDTHQCVNRYTAVAMWQEVSFVSESRAWRRAAIQVRRASFIILQGVKTMVHSDWLWQPAQSTTPPTPPHPPTPQNPTGFPGVWSTQRNTGGISSSLWIFPFSFMSCRERYCNNIAHNNRLENNGIWFLEEKQKHTVLLCGSRTLLGDHLKCKASQ